MRALEKRLGLSGLNYRAEEKVKLFQHRIAHATAAIDTSAPREWAEKKENEAIGKMSPSRSKTAAKERAALIALDNQLLARRIFNIMESPSAISEIINDTRHLDVHPGTMNFKARVEESHTIARDNRIMGERLSKIKPYYGFDDLNANRGMLAHKIKKQKKSSERTAEHTTAETTTTSSPTTVRTPAIVPRLPTEEANTQAKRPGQSISARGPAPIRSQNQSPAPATSGSQSARAAVGEKEKDKNKNRAMRSEPTRTPHGVVLFSYKIQEKQRIDIVVLKSPSRDLYGILGKCAASGGQRYEMSFTSEQVSTLVDGDLLVTNLDKAEVWEFLFKKVTLMRVDAFNSIYHAIATGPDSLLDAVISKRSDVQPTPPTKPEGSRPTSQGGGRAGKVRANKKPTTTTAAAVAVVPAHGASSKQTDKASVPASAKGGVSPASQEIGDSAEHHTAAAKLQALQRGKKAKAHADKLRQEKATLQAAAEIGDSAEHHTAAAKLQAMHRGKKAKAHVEKLRQEKEKEALQAAAEIGDSAEHHTAAAKLQAMHRGKKAKAHVDKLRQEKAALQAAAEIGDSAEHHTAAAKLQALHRGKKAKAHVDKLRQEKEIATTSATPSVSPAANAKIVAKLTAGSVPGAALLLAGATAAVGTNKSPLSLKDAATIKVKPKAPTSPRQALSGRPKPK